MGDIDLDTAPVTAPVEDGLATTETWVDEIPPEPAELPSQADESTSRRRLVWPVAAVAGLVIVVVVGVLIWSLWPGQPPQAPQSLRIVTTQAASVELQWGAPDDGPNAESYVIMLGEEELASVDAPATSYVVTALDPNTRYEFVVVALDGDRRSEPSGAIAATTNPGLPSSLQIEDRGATSARLVWDAPPGPIVDSYVILNEGDEVGSVDAPATSYVVTALDPNTRYEFVVVGLDGDRRSEPSEAIAVTTDPGLPSSLQIEDRGATSARLVWDAPPGPIVDSYVILNEGDELGVVAHPVRSFVVADLIPGATYEFSVAAQDGLRRSIPVRTTVTATAPSPAEVASDSAANTTDTIVLTWPPPAGVGAPTEYIVIRDGETVANIPGDTLSYTDTGLDPATAYEYNVAAHWGFDLSEPTNSVVVATVEPPVADARLVGTWSVGTTLVQDPGGNMDVGTTWTSRWDFEPSCDAGACDVTLAGNNSPPGFNYKSFTIDLIRDGASYAGSTTAQITVCNSAPVENTVTARLTVDAAGVDDGTWVANSWIGTLEISSPYTEVGQYYCSAQTVRQDLTATR